jgi:hypothetical protein
MRFGSVSPIGAPARSGSAEAVRDVGRTIGYVLDLRLALWPDAAATRDGLQLGPAGLTSPRSARRRSRS